MPALKRTDTDRAALAKAIESKVERMELADLVTLASTLKVRVPATVRAAAPRRARAAVARPAHREGMVLWGGGIGPVASAAERDRRLDAITVDDASADWVESEFVGAGELARRLGVSRGTLDNWRNAGKIIALRKGLRNFVYPLRQFDRRRPLEGLGAVAGFFASDEETWEWLVAPNRMTSGKPPIDALRVGEVSQVTSAAAGAFDYA